MTASGTDTLLAELVERLARIEAILAALAGRRAAQEWYSTAELGRQLGRAEYTVREWCRQGRVRASRTAHARGPHPEWRVAHAEVERVRREGLLPISH